VLIKQFFSIQNAINLLLRGFSIVGRFLLVILITYKFAAEELGIFGVFSTSIILGVQLVGFDYYVYASRELLKDHADRAFIFWNQFLFQLVIYVLATPALLFVFSYEFLDWSYFYIFFLILLLEHISGEQYRLLLLFGKSIQASILLFIKSASWVFFMFLLWQFREAEFYHLFVFWSLGLVIAIIFGLIHLKDEFKGDFKFSFEEIKTALKISTPFFLSTIFLKLTEYSNRYIIDAKLGKSDVGVYTLYSNFSTVLSTVVFTLVVMVQYPLLIKTFSNDSSSDQIERADKLLRDSFFSALLFAPLITIGVWVFVSFYKDGVYNNDFWVFVILILMNILICVNYATHYILYAKKRDSILIISYFIGSIVTMSLTFYLIEDYKLMGTAVANLFGFIIIVVIQFVSVWKSRKSGVG
jgi:O-antigen/teichoic acid export membrane protein